MVMVKENIALIFDMDGVVVDNARFHFLAWKEFAGKHGISVSIDEVKSWFGSTNEEILRRLFRKDLSVQEGDKYASEKEEIYRKLYSPHIKAMKGIKNILKNSSLAGLKIGLATSAPPENVDFVLNKTGLAGYFNQIVDESHIYKGKPDPEIFLTCASILNTEPENAIVFEDSVYGIEAAGRAGMKVVGVATSHSADKLSNTGMVIEDFDEIDLEDILQLLKK